jgi:hypothetical protein
MIDLSNISATKMQEAAQTVLFWSGDLGGTNGSFMENLMAAISRADMSNRARLAEGFPELVTAYLMWQHGRVEELFDFARLK